MKQQTEKKKGKTPTEQFISTLKYKLAFRKQRF